MIYDISKQYYGCREIFFYRDHYFHHRLFLLHLFVHFILFSDRTLNCIFHLRRIFSFIHRAKTIISNRVLFYVLIRNTIITI